MRIGLFPLAAKPYHAGHHAMVEAAASSNDKVLLFVSTSDRKRKGEFPILGKDMMYIWKNEIEKILPNNVEVYYGGSPVRNVYDTLVTAEEDPNNTDTYVVYSDPVDTAQNYPEANLHKYCGNLRGEGRCILAAEESPESFTRGVGTPNISGTAIRAMLQNGDKAGFDSVMPAGLNSDNVFNILTQQTQSEVFLRSYIKAILK